METPLTLVPVPETSSHRHASEPTASHIADRSGFERLAVKLKEPTEQPDGAASPSYTYETSGDENGQLPELYFFCVIRFRAS